MTGTDERGHYLRELLDVDYTDEQLRVATHPLAAQLVVAGAGSGKTAVMAARVVHAVGHYGVAPGRVLGLTFTTKAAGELAERVRRSLARLTRRAGRPVPADADGFENPADELPTVSTYHAYAAALVRDHALRIGREPVTTLLTEAMQWQLALRVARSATGPFEHLDWTTPHVARLLLALSGEMAEHLVDADAVRDFDRKVVDAIDGLPKVVKDVALIAERARGRDELLTLVAAYDALKSRLDLIDYGDQVALAARIAERAPVVGAVERSRFGLVVLDEYQDTGVAQRLLLTRLYAGGHPVTAVGDPHQAIYGWRGASVGNLLRFGEHFAPADGSRLAAMPLMTSFRCGGRILAAANAIAGPLRRAGGRRPALDVPSLAAAPGSEDAGAVVVARVETDRQEAALVADRLAALLAAGTPAREVAVLARRRADFPRLHHALVARDVPVEVVGLGGLLEMPEVADVVAVLSLLVDATDNPAAVRLLTGPRWRIGVRDLATLGRRAAHLATWAERSDDDAAGPGDQPRGLDHNLRAATAAVDPVEVVSLVDAVESPGDLDRYSPEAVARFAAFTDELRRLRGLLSQPLVELVGEVVRTIGLDVEIEAEVERVAVARMANLAAFADHAARYSGLEGETDLRAFLGYLTAAADADNGLDAGSVSDADTVKLMTVHKAKGLEWDVVAVPGLVADVFPSKQRRTPWTRGAQVLPFDCRGDAADLPVLRGHAKADVDAFDDECRRDDADEERRLAYVAFTRARKVLVATGYCWAATRASRCDPSPYLDELRALGEPAVTVDCWCDDPAPEATNPLDRRAAGDVTWPVPPDPEHADRRRRAVALVAAVDELAPVDIDALAGTEAQVARAWAEESELLLDEARRLRATVREVELPRRLTASQVVALAEDPDAFAQSLARPMPHPPRPQARRGSRFHAWVEQLYAAAPLLEPDDLPGSGDDDISDAELAGLQQRFLDSGWAERRPVAVEQRFELLVGGRLVRGRIDAVYPVLDGAGAVVGYEVVDYKTGAVPADFAAASLQLSVYRLAWADLAGCDPEAVRAGFLYVRTGTLRAPDKLLSRAELATLLSAT